MFEIIIDEAVGEQDRVVSKFNFFKSILDASFKFIFCFNSSSETASKFLKAGRIDKQEIALNSLLIDLNGSTDVNFNHRNLALGLDALQLSIGGSVHVSVDFTPFNELSLLNTLGELFS